MEFKEVHKGIDSLYLSFWGDLKEGLLDEFEAKKQLAQSENLEDQALAVKIIDDHCFEIRDKGQGFYSYVLADNWFYIKISASRKKLIPTVAVQISSELLNCSGFDYSVSHLRALLENHLITIQKERIKRVDIFVDFITDIDFEAISRKSWIARADKVNNYWTGNIFSGWTVGMGGDIAARLYDKTIEISISKKDFFKEIWSKQGWQPGQRVCRLEFELKRNFLSQLGVNSDSEVTGGQNDIWRICTQEWLRLAIENGDENKTRWKTHPVWQKIQDIRFGDGSYADLKREVSKSRMPNEERLFINGLGYLISFAALHGYDNLAEASNAFLHNAGAFLDIRAIGSEKFTDSLDYISKKIKLKKRQYNKPDNAVPF
jgi:hypothetical protein